MSAMSDYLENKLIDHILRGRAFAVPAGIYVALHTAAPDEDASPTNEVVGGSYARVLHGPADDKWEATQGGTPAAASNGVGGATQNAGAITFPAPTGNWGQATHWSLWDSLAGGNMLLAMPLTTPKTINAGDPAPSFAPGAADLTFA